MKSIRLFVLMGVAFLVGGQSLFSQTKAEKKEQKAQEVKAMVEEQRFTISVDRALPMGGRSVNLTSPYSLELRGDSVVSYLPYFGRAYSVPYGGGDGMRFEKPITDYQVSYNKKGTAQIKFVTRSDDDTYRFNVDVHPSGSASISVTPTNRQSISYQGELREKKE